MFTGSLRAVSSGPFVLAGRSESTRSQWRSFFVVHRVAATPDGGTYRRLQVIRRWAEMRLGRRVALTEVLNVALELFASRYCQTGRVRRREELLRFLKGGER